MSRAARQGTQRADLRGARYALHAEWTKTRTVGGTFWLLLIFGLPFVILGAFIALIVWIVRMATRRQAPVPA